MSFSRVELPDEYINNQTEVEGQHLERAWGYLNFSLVPLWLHLGPGILPRAGVNAFKVTANGTSSVSVAAGACNALHNDYGSLPLEKSTSTVISGLPVSSTRYLFAAIEISELNDSRKTGLPLFDANVSDTLNGGYLLAQLDIDGAGVVTVTDKRQLAGIQSLADADALPNMLYYSTTISKLAYKSPAGVVNALH
jgi:hypothetical protein